MSDFVRERGVRGEIRCMVYRQSTFEKKRNMYANRRSLQQLLIFNIILRFLKMLFYET